MAIVDLDYYLPAINAESDGKGVEVRKAAMRYLTTTTVYNLDCKKG